MVREYGYEYDAVLNEEVWRETKGNSTDEKLFGALSLRSGRDALKAVAREYEPCVALLPALACDSMVRPFEQYGHNVKYYRLNPDYSIDLNGLKVGDERVLFLYMDYFGLPATSDLTLENLRTTGNVVFIEDRTHNLIWERESSFQPDYVVASLRKWLPIPDGGLLWGEVSKPLSADASFSTARLKAQCMRHEFLNSGDERIKTEFRRIFSTVSDVMEHDEPTAMSAYSHALAKNTDWDILRVARKRNAEALISELKTSPFVSFIQRASGFSDLYVAFTTPNRDEVQRRLAAE